MKFDNVTFVVDLNDVDESGNTFISRGHTLEHGRGQAVSYHGLAMHVGDRVEVFSDDENMTWEAEIVRAVDSDQFEVSIRWDTGLRIRLGSQDFGYASLGTSYFTPVQQSTFALVTA